MCVCHRLTACMSYVYECASGWYSMGFRWLHPPLSICVLFLGMIRSSLQPAFISHCWEQTQWRQQHQCQFGCCSRATPWRESITGQLCMLQVMLVTVLCQQTLFSLDVQHCGAFYEWKYMRNIAKHSQMNAVSNLTASSCKHYVVWWHV